MIFMTTNPPIKMERIDTILTVLIDPGFWLNQKVSMVVGPKPILTPAAPVEFAPIELFAQSQRQYAVVAPIVFKVYIECRLTRSVSCS